MNIGGSRGGKCQGYAPLGLLFSCSFQEKLVKIIEWTPLFWDWHPLSTEPPLLNAQKHAHSRERSLNQSCCEYTFDCLFNINRDKILTCDCLAKIISLAASKCHLFPTEGAIKSNRRRNPASRGNMSEMIRLRKL